MVYKVRSIYTTPYYTAKHLLNTLCSLSDSWQLLANHGTKHLTSAIKHLTSGTKHLRDMYQTSDRQILVFLHFQYSEMSLSPLTGCNCSLQYMSDVWYLSVRHMVPVCQTYGTFLSDVWYLSVRCMVPVCQMSGTCLSDALYICLTDRWIVSYPFER